MKNTKRAFYFSVFFYIIEIAFLSLFFEYGKYGDRKRVLMGKEERHASF